MKLDKLIVKKNSIEDFEHRIKKQKEVYENEIDKYLDKLERIKEIICPDCPHKIKLKKVSKSAE